MRSTVGYVLAFSVCLISIATGCRGSTGTADATNPSKPTLVLVSIDGFRWDYLDRYEAPNLNRLAGAGTRAEKLIPVFPTKTFPNQYAAVTGLYAGHHGVISNTIFDPETGATFRYSDPEQIAEARWWGGEPIWVTAELQGRVAATHFWPGSEAPIKGVRPTFWVPYDNRISGKRRVDRVLEWLDLPAEKRPDFITLYFSEVDEMGHRFGPDSRRVAAAVKRTDALIGRLVAGIERRGMGESVNLIIMSDHGMSDASPDRVIFVDDFVDPDSDVRLVEINPVVMAFAETGELSGLHDGLASNPHLTVYWKDELPDRFHLDHPRTPPLLAIADPGWVIVRRQAFERRPEVYTGGVHGYDNRAPDMAGIFIAYGPAFRRGLMVEPFEIVHLYELMCAVLGLEPALNDGDPGVTRALLESPLEVAIE